MEGLVEYQGSASDDDETLTASAAASRLSHRTSKTPSGIKVGQTKSSSAAPPPLPTRASVEPEAGPSRLPDGAHPPAPLMGGGKPVWRLDRFGLHEPDPDAECDPDVEARFAGFHAAREAQGESFNTILMRNKMFRNPRILDKLVSFIDIDDKGSTFGSMWDRQTMLRDGSAKVIGDRQRKIAEEREAAKASGKRSSIEFASSSAKQSSDRWDRQPPRPGSAVGDEDARHHARRRRSRSPRLRDR